MPDYQAYAGDVARKARAASRSLAATSTDQRRDALRFIADEIDRAADQILAANRADLDAGVALSIPLKERLKLSPAKIARLAEDVRKIADQPDPVGRMLQSHTRPDGLRIDKIAVPLGVVLFVYESRPNVTSDAAALCIKSGNAVIMRGGKEARHSNTAIAAAVTDGLTKACVDPAAVQLVEHTDRQAVSHLLKCDQDIDLVIPRGGESLIRAVVQQSTIPVLKHFTGNCHVYVDKSVDPDVARKVCLNAKTGYPGGAACNVAEKILFHRDVADVLLPVVLDDLAKAGVRIRGDDVTRRLFPSALEATESDWPTEYLDLIVAVKVVDSIDGAIDHINKYGSRHTDAILSTDAAAIDQFVKTVDTASVMVNASTRFADGGEYGLGAELGISTDKLHARGPMGAFDLCTYKWVVTGSGHVRVT